jgi:SpoVK/Ycf46/Vps4 family AAA+-type ATPase
MLRGMEAIANNQDPRGQDRRGELETLLASRFSLIVVESREEARVLDLVRAASSRVRRPRGWALFQWTVTEGLNRLDVDTGGPQKIFAEPGALLKHLKATTAAGIYVLCDFHPYLQDPINVRMLKDIAQSYEQTARTIVLMSHELTLPQELEHLASRLRLALPSREERRGIISRVAREWAQSHGGQAVKADRVALERLIENLSGLSATDTERLARQAIFDDGALTMADLPRTLSAKIEILNRGGLLSYEPHTAKFADVGGLKNLRQWLTSRKPAFSGSAPTLDSPKGVLLLGVQGCGKSLAARAAAGIFGVPLLRLDFAALYSKWHGESEKNLRESLHAAEALSPCVLWVDEMEKAVSGGDGDSGTSRRVLGTFLTWLAEQRSRTFVIATANDISALPPELVRKGRFDEIFFVDLPNLQARADILTIHARKRGLNLTAEELAALADRSDGFSGAELEQAVVSALFAAHSQKSPVTATLLDAEMAATHPLSTVMEEQITALRDWASDRTVPAD